MKDTHKKRLRKLADHLLNGNLGHKKFNFGTWNGFPKYHVGPKNVCGTEGCAVGECPVVFPSHWKFDEFGDPKLRRGSWGYPRGDASEFFGLGYDEAKQLFVPGYGLPSTASRRKVARNILDFLSRK